MYGYHCDFECSGVYPNISECRSLILVNKVSNNFEVILFNHISEIMSLKEEEARVRAIVQNLVPVYLPDNHGRVKWDKESSNDLIQVIETLGTLCFLILLDLF